MTDLSDQSQLVDNDAVVIGELYERGRKSLVDSAKYSMECGARLATKKAEMQHGDWLPWLAENASVLGFSTRQTAAALIRAAKSNGTSTLHLDAPAALAISRKTWGNNETHVSHNSGNNEWYTPREYIEAARRG